MEARLDPLSHDVVEDRREALLHLFPEARSEGAGSIDFVRLRQALGDAVEDGPERFGMSWPGRAEAIRTMQERSIATLLPAPEESVDFDTTQNLIIEGDNLEVLKILQKSYLGKVKMIYIDPPYNTGNDFIYPDNYSESLQTYLAYTGQIDESGKRFSTNTEADGRFHSKWMSMMYPRLALARNLLTDDGVIFISIDDNEVSNLRNLADEIFGTSSLIAQFVWAAGRKNDSKFVSVSHEYMVCYCKSLEALKTKVGEWRSRKDGLDAIYAEYRRLSRIHAQDYGAVSDALKAWFQSLPDGDPSKRHRHYSVVDARGVYFPDNISWPGGGGPKYPVLHPSTGRPVAVPSRGWRISNPEKMQALIDDDRVHFGPDETYVPCTKAYLVDREFEVPYSVFYQDGRGATKRLRELMTGDYFENPKDETVLQRVIEFVCPDDALVLDFFSGSGTTGHAVLAQNAKDGGSRRFILVQLPEPVEEGSEVAKAGFGTIAEITKERVRRAAKGIAKEAGGASKLKRADGSGPQDLGFRVLKLAPSNFQVWDADAAQGDVRKLEEQLTLQVDHVLSGRSGLDVVFEVMAKSKRDLSSKVESRKVGKGEAWMVNGTDLVVVVDPGVDLSGIREIAGWKPTSAVILDRCFEGKDALKANARKIFEDAGVDYKTI